jgi:hypothetical protein
MWQRLALDRHRRSAYYGVAFTALGVLGACGIHIPPLGPADLPPIERRVAEEWVRPYLPAGPVRYDLRWSYTTQQGTAKGRAAVRFVPPDSVRFDYRAPFGRSGAAVVVGDDVVWQRPEEESEGFIQVAPLFWAALGIPRMPSDDVTVTGMVDGETRLWRYAGVTDTLTYRARAGLPGASLQAQMRRAGRVVGAVEVAFADTVLQPASASMIFPGSASTVEFTVVAIEPITAVDSTIWKAP